jgi:hypothetical protein
LKFDWNLVEITNVVSAITILDELSIDAISEFLTWITDNALDVYPATSTTELLDSVACDIFCTVKDTCVVTLQDIHNYFYNRVNDARPLSFTDFIEFGMEIATIIAGGDSRLIFDAVMLSTTSTALLIDGLLGGAIKTKGGASDLYTHMKAYSNDSDNDWTILCEDCPPAASAGYINVNAESILINGLSISGAAAGDGWSYDVNEGDIIEVSITGQIGVRFNTVGGIFGSDPLTNITISLNGGGLNVYNRSALIGTTNGTYSAGFFNCDNTCTMTINYLV